MLRFLVRLCGFIILAAGFVQLVVDGTASIADDALRYARLADLAARHAPSQLAGLQAALTRTLGAKAWDPVALTALQAPASLAGIVLGFILLLAARRRAERIGHPARL